jgi:hypothetical protein
LRVTFIARPTGSSKRQTLALSSKTPGNHSFDALSGPQFPACTTLGTVGAIAFGTDYKFLGPKIGVCKMTVTIQRISLYATAALFWLSTISAAVAQEPRPNNVTGTLTLSNITYKLSQGVAYETKQNDESHIVALLSDRAIPWAKIQATLQQNKGSDETLQLDQPYLKLFFEKSGKLDSYTAADGHTTVGHFGDEVKGKFDCKSGKSSGDAHTASDPDSLVKWAFDVRWDLTAGAQVVTAPPPAPSGPVKPSVTGEFQGNGQAAKLAYVSAQPGEAFDGKPVTVIVFTEKDHSRDAKAATNAGFGTYGSALVVSVLPDGKIIGCEVSHAAHAKRPFSTSGTIRIGQFELGNGRVAGEITTDGEQKFFDQTWDVKLKFVAPYVSAEANPAAAGPAGEARAKLAANAAASQQASRVESVVQASETAAKPADKLNVKDLALPSGATDIVYKKLVEHMTFRSNAAVQPLAEEFSKTLAAQGWTPDKGGDLVTARSAILDRSRGAAKLTIFVKPAGQGSRVTIMSEGLDWDGK